MSSVSKKSKTIKKKKGSRKKKDPNAPKRPRSAYIIYSQDKRDEVKKLHPNAKPAELMQLMGKMWKDLSEAEKKPYTDKAGEDKSRFSDEMKDYQPPEDDDEEEDEDEDDDDDDDDEDGGKKKKKKKAKGKRKRDPNAPKKGMSAYLHYSQSVREKVKGEHPNARSAELMQIIGKMWKELSEAQKQPFFDLAKRDRDRYDADKATYLASSGGATAATTKKPAAKPKAKAKPKVVEPEPEEEEEEEDGDDGGDDDDEEDDDDDEEDDDDDE